MAEQVILTAADAAEWSGGRLFGDSLSSVYSAEVDSRKCTAGSLFFALAGERVDGHDFLKQVFENGASGAVVSAGWAESHGALIDEITAGGAFIIAADDTLAALQKIAAKYMSGIKGPIRIGITGSNGKTTTKELTAKVLEEKYSVVKTEGNYNSEIGLPLTVFNIKNHHEYAVIEMGINRLGEMDVLTEILRPDIVVITNIGTAHIGIFKDIETIAYEKRRAVSLFDGKGTLFISEDEAYANFLAEDLKGDTVFYGESVLKASTQNFTFSSRGLRGWQLSCGGVTANLPLVGIHNLKNALCAWAVGRFAGLADAEIMKGLERVESLFGRCQIIEGPVTIIQDCYNANADSLIQSIEFADGISWKGAKRYIIGDMKELGDNSLQMHRAAGRAAAESAADEVIFFGEDSHAAFTEAAKTATEMKSPVFVHTTDYAELEEKVVSVVEAGDLLLIKGSRSMNLERLLEPIAEKFRSAEC